MGTDFRSFSPKHTSLLAHKNAQREKMLGAKSPPSRALSIVFAI